MQSSLRTLRTCHAVGRLARRHTRPGVALPQGANRQVHAQAASTDLEYREVGFVAEDARASPSGSSRGTPAAGSYRVLPMNYAPETPFTVDNPAAADAQRFVLHSSVPYWTDKDTTFASWYSPERSIRREASADDLVSTIVQLFTTAAASGDAESASYWLYHLTRTGFFTATAVTGAVTHHLAYQAQGLLQSLGLSNSSNSSSGNSTSSSTGSSDSKPKTPLANLSANAQAELINRLQEALAVYSRDLEYIKAGSYKLPWDMTDFPSHRQFNPLFMARMTVDFCAEAVATLNRRLDRAPTDNWFVSNMYPQYYASNTFHYQTDGWLSSRSADVYEFSTETLFFGRQDAMQRTALLPLSDFIRSRRLNPADMTLAEVGCGTGRFHTFVKDNFPTMRTIASDLSPFYLARARDNVNYWKQERAARLDLGGPEGTGTTYIQAAMENLPLPDASVDALVCVYCFHEMPESARAAAAKEWFRVVKPGGLVVLTDSVQLGDRPAWNKTLGAFGNMNEPHYRNYIACDMGGLFEAAGFSCDTKYMSSATKTWSFIKPETLLAPPPSAAAAAGDAAGAAGAPPAGVPGSNGSNGSNVSSTAHLN